MIGAEVCPGQDPSSSVARQHIGPKVSVVAECVVSAGNDVRLS